MSSEQDHYSKSGMVMFILSMSISFLFFIYIAFIHPGVENLDKFEQIKKVEKGSSPQAEVKSVDPESEKEPWITSKEMIAAGAKVYAQNCATCHGKTGLADGIAATPDTRNLVTGNWKAGGTSVALFKTLQNGLEGTGMVSFKASVSPANRWALVHWIRSITENKVEDVSQNELKSFASTAD